MKTIEDLEKEILEAKKELLKEIKNNHKGSTFPEVAFFTIMAYGAALLLPLLTSF